MKSLFAAALLALTLFTTNVFAQAAAPESLPEKDAITNEVPKNLLDRWSYQVHLQGLGNQAGVGLAFETPFAWDWISFRVGISSDRLHGSDIVEDFQFYTVHAALKLQGELNTTSNVLPYVLIAFDNFIEASGANNNAAGSKFSFGPFFGADFQFVGAPTFRKDLRVVRSFFVEAGIMDSNFGPDISGFSPVDVSDGFIARVGLRSYF